MMKITEKEIAYMVANKIFNIRQNLIVPNVFWGLEFNYEVDLLVVTPSRYASEVEIKTSFADLKKDFDKRHFHDDKRIKNLWYAIPEDIYEKSIDFIPEEAGIIVVIKNQYWEELRKKEIWNKYHVRKMQEPRPRKAVKLTEKEYSNLQRLMAMRYWTMLAKYFNKK